MRITFDPAAQADLDDIFAWIAKDNIFAARKMIDGSIGAYYSTNHAILMLDDPREFLNWSRREWSFVHEPLTNTLQTCATKPHFVTTLH